MRYLRTMFRKLFRRTGVRRGALFAVVYILASAMLVFNLVPEAITLEIGQASPRYIGAPRQVEDRYTTLLLRQEAASAVAEVFEQNHNVYSQVLQEQHGILEMFMETAELEISENEKLDIVRAHFPYELSEPALKSGLTLEETVAEQLHAEMALAMDSVYGLGIKLDGLDAARQSVSSLLNASTLRVEYRVLMIEIARNTMRHNMTPNAAATSRLRQEAEARVSPVIVQKTQKVIGQGEIATEREMQLLQDLGLLRSGMDWKVLSGSMLFVLLCLAIPALYLYFLSPKVYLSNSMANLLGTALLGGLIFAWAGTLVSGYLVPVAAVSILLTVLIDARVGLVAGISLALMSGGLLGFEFRFILVALLGTAAGVYAVVHHKGNRAGLVWAGAIVGGVNVLSILALGLLFGSGAQELLRDTLIGFGGGVTASILAIGSLPFLENLFGMTSAIKLMELANPHQDLLKRLLVEAPGTYHHSIIVANLAEAACEQVGADALRARVGAYYHDVGKLTRPYFFIENQTMMENPHDNYPPNLSALIITSHVRDGVKLAKEHGVPDTIVEIIGEHHGTSIAHYFHARALESGQVNEADFMYEGPRPRSKESAIVMLADVVEAAVRSINAPTAAKMEQKVRQLIKEKLDEGQLNESDLALKDLTEIGTAFVRHLSGVFHKRIEYPERGRGERQNAGIVERSSGEDRVTGDTETAAKSC